ncbi:MAG: endonuclease/exonuclease/phosphatase family protein [Acidimicrobiales bacterium]
MRILTWNLWWQFGPWEQRLDAIVTTLRHWAPDVLCLQEVWTDPGGRSSAQVIAEALGHPSVVDEIGFSLGEIGFGNAVTSRFPLAGRDVVALPSTGEHDEHRRLVVADLDTGGEAITVACTHLNWRPDHGHVRRAQVASIGATLARRRQAITVLCGDLNAEPSSDEVRALTGLAPLSAPGLVFTDAWAAAGHGAGNTWDNANPFAATEREPDRRIDYVLVAWPYPAGYGHPVRAELVGTAPVAGIWPSDHYGVVVDLADQQAAISDP